MGNSDSSHFPSESWNFDHRSDYYDICRSSKGVYAEKHIVPNNPKIDAQDQMEVYNFRHKTDKPIVHVYDAEYQKADNTCGKQKNITVYSEHIPHRLSDTVNLTHGQGLYVMSEALYGFEQLHHRFGGFPITDDNIGFNSQGEVRVWHSPNFGSNHLPRDGIMLMSTKNPRNFDERIQKKQEQQMVEDIWFAVDQHARMRRDFAERANWFRDMDFHQARRMINEQIQYTKDYVPDHLSFKDAWMHRGERDQYNTGSYDHYSNGYRDNSHSHGHRDSKFGTYKDSRVSPLYEDRNSHERFSGNREFRNSRYQTEQYGSDYRGSRASNHYNDRAHGSYAGPTNIHGGSQAGNSYSHKSNNYNREIIHNAQYRTNNDY